MRGVLHHSTRAPSLTVGVATTTEELYQAFKDVNILLIEPLAKFEPFLRDICDSYNAQYVLAAAGENRGSAIINVHLTNSDQVFSIRSRAPVSTAHPGRSQWSPSTTSAPTGTSSVPYLMKVDVQGSELQVLVGATHTLQQTEAVILRSQLI
jgi:FkbM family methyltransferase